MPMPCDGMGQGEDLIPIWYLPEMEWQESIKSDGFAVSVRSCLKQLLSLESNEPVSFDQQGMDQPLAIMNKG
jgi:hypothetical protein